MEMQSGKTVAQIVAGIQALDLDPIKVKLMDPEEGQGWSREHTDRMATAYRRFLTLLVTHPETPIAPSKEIDKFWHGHILDTMKYAEDCERVFGSFLHHFPYFGMRGQEDAAQLAEAGSQMQRLYEQEFGEPMPGANAAFCYASKKAAFCYASTKAAFCYASTRTAFCYASTKAAYSDAATKASFCYASNQAAFCYAAVNGSKRPDTATRPALALAA